MVASLSQGERRLVALMFTDMVGYTALGQMNESLSLTLVEEQRKLIRPILQRHSGREVKTMGDAFLVEFPSALDAVRCAYDIQRATREFNISLPEDRRIHLRVGLHLGDVVESQGDISGDAVNVASRIEGLAEDGGVCLSRQVYDHVQGKFELPLISLGTRPLKNVSAPTEVFKMAMPWDTGSFSMQPRFHDRHRIAILPLANISYDRNDEYFADGLTEELIDMLSQVKGLEVIARTSVMSYKKTDKKISEIGKELRVGSIIEGSVRKAGDKIRVSVDLIDVNSEGRLWSSRYDKNLDDIFAIQSDIAARVGGSVSATLDANKILKVTGRETNDMIAYTSFLQARELLHQTAESALKNALNQFERAIERDPDFARANVGVAQANHALASHGYIPFYRAIENARASLARALEINEELAEAHSTLSAVEIMDDKLRTAESEAHRAIEINPNLADAYSSLAGIKTAQGDLTASIELREKAYLLDPLEPWNATSLGDEYFWAGREKEALDIWSATVKFAPYITYDSMIDYYLSKGNYEKASEAVDILQKLDSDNPESDFWTGYLAALKGDTNKAKQKIEVLEKSSKEGAVTINAIALIYNALDDLDAFFAQMRRSLEAHTITMGMVRYSPLLSKARADPRMRELLDTYVRVSS